MENKKETNTQKESKFDKRRICFYSVSAVAVIAIILSILFGIKSAKNAKSLLEQQEVNNALGADNATLQGEKDDLQEELDNIVRARHLQDCTWEEIAEISASGLASQVFDIGDTKTVTLKHQDGTDFHQTVRIVGFNYDVLASDPTKKAGITFEFCDLISDSKGNSLATQFNDIKTTINGYDTWTPEATTYDVYNNYSTSNIRYMLDGGLGELSTNDGYGIRWVQYLDAIPNDLSDFVVKNSQPEYKTVLDMLPDDLQSVIKTVNKDSLELESYTELKDFYEMYKQKTVKAKLFLLSRDEITTNRTVQDPGLILGTEKESYKFYDTNREDTSEDRQTRIDDLLRTKSGLHFNNTDCWYDDSWDPKYSFKVFGDEGVDLRSYAGLCGSENDTYMYYGGIASAPYWTRTPLSYSSELSDLWTIDHNGVLVANSDYNGLSSALGVAPGFCI